MQRDRAMPFEWRYSPGEMWADGVVHVVGVVGAVAASIVLLALLAGRASAGELAVVSVYLASLLLCFGASAAYNLCPVGRIKWRLRRLDRAAIYLLIAGTYTPFMAASGTWRLLAAVWTLALAGALLKLTAPGGLRRQSTLDRLAVLLYLALGWSGLIAYEEVFAGLTPTVFWLILAGGLTYSAGVLFHMWETLRFQTAIWHGFVLAAATTHFVAVWVESLI